MCIRDRLPDDRQPRPAAGRDRGRLGPQRGSGRKQLRVPDALRNPSRRTEEDRRPWGPDAGLSPVRPGVVRLSDAPDGGAPGQHDVLSAIACNQRLRRRVMAETAEGPRTVAILGVGVMGSTLLAGLL